MKWRIFLSISYSSSEEKIWSTSSYGWEMNTYYTIAREREKVSLARLWSCDIWHEITLQDITHISSKNPLNILAYLVECLKNKLLITIFYCTYSKSPSCLYLLGTSNVQMKLILWTFVKANKSWKQLTSLLDSITIVLLVLNIWCDSTQ